MSPSDAPPSPLHFFRTANAYQSSAALKAAVELGVFTAIASTPGGTATAAQVGERSGASERGARILCDFLTIIGFLSKEQERYRLTPDSAAFLDQRSPAYMGSMLDFVLSPYVTRPFDNLAAAVRKGGCVDSELGTLEPEHPIWVQFARSMQPLVANVAKQVVELVPINSDRTRRMLDIASGHGMFGIAFAQRYPGIEVVLQDWPNVLEVAMENAQKASVSDRVALMPGSAFEVDLGTGYDIILLPNFLHHFDVPTCESLIRKLRPALKPDGRVVTVEFVPNDDRVTPPGAAMFALQMLAGTPAGDAYTFAEIDSMFRNAGFSRSELHVLPPGVNSVVISYP